eukprot:jgi/Hompol1/4515/HPOL_003682-RA
MKTLCFGSINIDEIYHTPDIVRPEIGRPAAKAGLTWSTREQAKRYRALILRCCLEAKASGANQSVALAKAGEAVVHGGRVGQDGKWVLDLMASHGVDTSQTAVDASLVTGRAIIQVSSKTHDNAIVLNPGANHAIKISDIDAALSILDAGDLVLLQNEINADASAHLIKSCHAKDLIVCLNPAPCPSDLVKSIPLDKIDILVVNTTEAESLAHQFATSLALSSADICIQLMNKLPCLTILVITLGPDGAVAGYRAPGAAPLTVSVSPSRRVNVKDTTGAGDTFVGYFCASLVKQLSSIKSTTKLQTMAHIGSDHSIIKMCLEIGVAAAGLCCEAVGAMPSIPLWDDLSITLSK